MHKLLRLTQKSFLSTILALVLCATLAIPVSFNGNRQGDVSTTSLTPVKDSVEGPSSNY